MNTIEVIRYRPGIFVKNIAQVHHFPSKVCLLPRDANPVSRTSPSLRAKPSSGLQYMPILKSQRPLHVCLASGRGMMENNEGSSWKSFEKSMENLKGKSIEDLLREQIQKGEYYKNGGNGAKPPGGGGGSGSGGPGGSEDGSFAGMSDETLQVVLAAIGFVLLYICVIDGVELAKLARDYIKYLLTGNQSVRLKRAMYKWVRFYKNMAEKKEVVKSLSEKAPDRWYRPDHYQDSIRNYMKPDSAE